MLPRKEVSMKAKITKLTYLEEENMIIDDGGHIVYDIFRIITPNELAFLKNRRASYTFKRSFKKWIYIEYEYDTLTKICEYYRHG